MSRSQAMTPEGRAEIEDVLQDFEDAKKSVRTTYFLKEIQFYKDIESLKEDDPRRKKLIDDLIIAKFTRDRKLSEISHQEDMYYESLQGLSEP